jgi:hypothetical protein
MQQPFLAYSVAVNRTAVIEQIKNPRSKLRGIGGRKEADQKNAASCGEYVPKEIQSTAAAALAEQLIRAGNRLVNFQLRGLRVPRSNMRELVTSKPSRVFVRRTIAQRSFAPPS